jgi:hypothetical protein
MFKTPQTLLVRIKSIRTSAVVANLILAISGCSTGSIIQSGYGDPPPQIAFLGARDAAGKDYLTWHRPWAFGPVPAEMQAIADISCMKVDFSLRATGYHPMALDRRGNPIPGGGFFCQLRSVVTDTSPPRVIVTSGESGWDRPSAFNALPADKVAEGIDACRQQNSNLKPLGFHPRPIDVDGQVMKQGGFLCVE